MWIGVDKPLRGIPFNVISLIWIWIHCYKLDPSKSPLFCFQWNVYVLYIWYSVASLFKIYGATFFSYTRACVAVKFDGFIVQVCRWYCSARNHSWWQFHESPNYFAAKKTFGEIMKTLILPKTWNANFTGALLTRILILNEGAVSCRGWPAFLSDSCRPCLHTFNRTIYRVSNQWTSPFRTSDIMKLLGTES